MTIMPSAKDLTGQKFNRLLLLKRGCRLAATLAMKSCLIKDLKDIVLNQLSK